VKLIEVALLEKETQKPGTFVGARPSKESMNMIQDQIKKLDVPNPIDKGKMHITVIYSRKHLPDFKARGKLDKPIIAKPDKLHIFPARDSKNALVLKIKCPELTKRHEEIMDEHEATYDFDEYRPHVTLSYDAGDYDLSKYNADDFSDIEITEEYDTPLKTDWLVKK
jgi:2'-5' RNA ligase